MDSVVTSCDCYHNTCFFKVHSYDYIDHHAPTMRGASQQFSKRSDKAESNGKVQRSSEYCNVSQADCVRTRPSQPVATVSNIYNVLYNTVDQ